MTGAYVWGPARPTGYQHAAGRVEQEKLDRRQATHASGISRSDSRLECDATRESKNLPQPWLPVSSKRLKTAGMLRQGFEP